jgi:hypothetical protein
MDKHDRPYRCTRPQCAKLLGFTSSSGFLRHEREVHAKHGGPKEILRCPVDDCKRHVGKAFSRMDGLVKHLGAVHNIKKSSAEVRRDYLFQSDSPDRKESVGEHDTGSPGLKLQEDLALLGYACDTYEPNRLRPGTDEYYDDDEWGDDYEPVGPDDQYPADYYPPPPVPAGLPTALPSHWMHEMLPTPSTFHRGVRNYRSGSLEPEPSSKWPEQDAHLSAPNPLSSAWSNTYSHIDFPPYQPYGYETDGVLSNPAVTSGASYNIPMQSSGPGAEQQIFAYNMAQPNPQTDQLFRCDECPQSFSRNHDLKRHKRIHAAVKPFPCVFCDKSFARKEALKVRSKLKFLIQSSQFTI